MDHSKLTIAQWAEEDKPREKLEALGAEALSKAELLAILIGSGSADEDAVALTKRILADVGEDSPQYAKASAILGKIAHIQGADSSAVGLGSLYKEFV